MSLKVVDQYTTYFPKKATWVCGFSKTGYFATYDSIPNTHLINVNNLPFNKETKDSHSTDDVVYSQREKGWKILEGKNFLCFSPTGNFLALSEQGYDPISHGGTGHQSSNAVHIARTDNPITFQSFVEHGDKIKDKTNNNYKRNVTFVSFSDDEKRIMTLSEDGVVLVRNIDLKHL